MDVINLSEPKLDDAVLRFQERFPDSLRSPLLPLRSLAVSTLKTLDAPSTKNEEWKYTDPSAVLSADYTLAESHTRALSKKQAAQFLFKGKYHSLVFLNGHFSKFLSNHNLAGEGVIISPISELSPEAAQKIRERVLSASSGSDYFSALNTTFCIDGTVILIPRGVVLEKEIQIHYLNTSTEASFVNVRNYIILEENAGASILESYQSAVTGGYFINVHNHVLMEQKSVLEYIRLQNDSEEARHISRTDVDQKRSSVFTAYTITTGGRMVRNDVNVRLSGEDSEAHLYGLYVCGGEQHIDNHTRVDHLVPLCRSNELYKGVLAGKSRGVFNGKVYVHPDAQKTNAFQQNKNLLLDDTARVDTKPQLEIFADDVKCTHGATIGRLNDDALFYLQSRGFGLELARKFLVFAFADDVVRNIKNAQVRQKLEEFIHLKLEIRLQIHAANNEQ